MDGIDWNELNNDAHAKMLLGRRADEIGVWNEPEEVQMEDKALFVAWLGELLSMTREEVTRCYLADEDTLVIQWRDGYTQLINIACDSRLAIIKDVLRQGDF